MLAVQDILLCYSTAYASVMFDQSSHATVGQALLLLEGMGGGIYSQKN